MSLLLAGEWIEILLEGSRVVVIPRDGVAETTAEILDNFRVSAACSKDLLLDDRSKK